MPKDSEDEAIFAKIQTRAEQFNKSTSEAEHYLRGIEERLVKSGVGVEAWVWLHDSTGERTSPGPEGPRGVVICTFLGYARIRHEGGWGLAISREYYAQPKMQGDPAIDEEVVPLLSAPREERVAARLKVSKLLKAIEAALAKRTALLESVES